ncbi:MAG: type II toxin-antitoxin system RelE/ParE family toxin [bacterium]
MRFSFHPRADGEFDQAVQYYEDCQPGLGLEFAEEVYAVIGRVCEYPDAWSAMSQNTRITLAKGRHFRHPLLTIMGRIRGGTQ